MFQERSGSEYYYRKRKGKGEEVLLYGKHRCKRDGRAIDFDVEIKLRMLFSGSTPEFKLEETEMADYLAKPGKLCCWRRFVLNQI